MSVFEPYSTALTFQQVPSHPLWNLNIDGAPNTATQMPVWQKRYASDAIFEDPMFSVNTPADREAQFASLPSIFPRIEVHRARNGADAKTYDVTPADATRDNLPESSKLKKLVRIEVPNTQVYYLPKFMSFVPLSPSKIEIAGVTKLTVEKDTGKVVKHQDVWNITGEHLPGGLPIVGSPSASIYAMIKSPLGKGISLGLRGMNQVGLLH